MMDQNYIAYIYSDKLRRECDRLPTMRNRASFVQDLIQSYRLLSKNNIHVIESVDATDEELKLFHSSKYIEFLKETNCLDLQTISIKYDEEQIEYGLGYDCPILERNFDFIKTIAGASVTAAKLLTGKKYKIAINWCGGWHHAQSNSAEGFCYVNDIVLAIKKLRETFSKILYLDLDIHHGDGVQNAFESDSNILTVSFHTFSPGFYPGTGQIDEIGIGQGKYYSINVPLKEGISPKTYTRLFTSLFPHIYNAFKPDAMVVQCGADSLNGDEIGGDTNLTLRTIGGCIEMILNCNIPTMFLGGGGYNSANTARLWTYLTSLVLQEELDNDIPDSCQFFMKYQPTYELHIDQGRRKDHNSDDYINGVIATVLSYCDSIR